MEGLKWVNSSLNSAAIEQRTLYLSSSSVNKDVPAVRIYKKAFVKTMGGRISRARAARRASRINPSPVAGEDDGSPREVIVADFSEESIPLGLREDDMRRRGSDSGSDSDTIDEEEAAESDVDEIGGSDDEDDGKPKPDIVLLDVVDSDSECIVCMNDKIEVRFEPCNHEICCADCSDKLDVCPMCRAPIRAVPKNMPEPEDETLTLDLLELLSRGPPGGAGGDPRGHLMARLSLGQLLIGLASAQEQGNQQLALRGGPQQGMEARNEQMMAQRRLLMELGSLMLSRVNGVGADVAGAGAGEEEELATPTSQWACGRCTLINEESDHRCVACYAHFTLSEAMHTEHGTTNLDGITAGGD